LNEHAEREKSMTLRKYAFMGAAVIAVSSTVLAAEPI
jgi:hypothetical protein